VGVFSVRRFRRDRIAWAKRRLQLKVLSLELKSLRQKVVSADGRGTSPAKRRLVRKLPRLAAWQKWLIAWLRRPLPWLTRFLRFNPMTYIRWLQARGRRAHALKIAEGKRRGRPPTPAFVVEAILAIKNAHPYDSAGRIARILSGGELKLQIPKNTVAKILKAHGFAPRPKGKQPPRESQEGDDGIALGRRGGVDGLEQGVRGLGIIGPGEVTG
jgi:hypothetical protein